MRVLVAVPVMNAVTEVLEAVAAALAVFAAFPFLVQLTPQPSSKPFGFVLPIVVPLHDILFIRPIGAGVVCRPEQFITIQIIIGVVIITVAAIIVVTNQTTVSASCSQR